MKKSSSIKTKLLAVAIVPAFLIGVAVMIVGILFMQNGMEEEILKGLLSSAYTYKDIGVNITDREAGDNAVEEDLKNNTGYDFTWFDGDTRKNSSLGASVIGSKAADTVIAAVIQGKQTFTSKKTQVAGQDYFVAYVPVLDDNGNVVSMAFTGVSRESVKNQINHSILILSLIVIGILILVTVVCYFIANGISKAINTVNDSIQHLAEGEFIKADKYLDRKDEIGAVLNNTNGFIDRLKEIVTHIIDTAEVLESASTSLNDVSEEVSTTMTNINSAVEEVANGATDQANSIQEAVTNVANIDTAIAEVSNTADSLTNKAQEMAVSSKSSEQLLSELERSLNDMSDNINAVSDAIKATSQAVDGANKKTEMINNIASQTNLLALNASIEAARAGDAGKGFAVVATEIGSLASDSDTTANQIKVEMSNLLKIMSEATEKIAVTLDLNTKVLDALHNTVDNTETLIQNIEETVTQVNTVSTNVDSCMQSKQVIVDAMNSLSAISEENAASTEETSASVTQLSNTVGSLATSASDLKSLTDTLRSDISFFKLNEVEK